MTKKPNRKQPQPETVAVTDEAFKHLVERLLNTPPKHKSSPKSKKQKSRSQSH